MKTWILLFALAVPTLTFAKPILNRQADLKIPINQNLYPDSENPNLFWIHANELTTCGFDKQAPVFSIRAFLLDHRPRVFATFDICLRHDPSNLIYFKNEILRDYPASEVRYLKAEFQSAPRIENFLNQADYKSPGVSGYCSNDWSEDSRFRCTTSAVGLQGSNELYTFMRDSTAVFSDGVPAYQVHGVEQDDQGQFKDVVKEYPATISPGGYWDYPELFNTEWKPSY